MRRTDLARAIMLGSAATFIVTMPVQAQTAAKTTQQAADQPPAPEATAAANDEGKDSLGENITVTARRTSESVQRVPSSISAFNERTLDRIQATDTTGLQGAVPNLNIVQGRGSSNATNIFIRGIGQPDALKTFDPAVGVYVDDAFSRIRGSKQGCSIRADRVLRGPQGTLYGKNTIGGAIKFVTRRPGDTFRANGSIAVGAFNQLELKGAASGPVSDTLAAGFAVMRSKHDGYVEDSANDREYNNKDSIGGRAALAFTPSENIRIDLTADYSHDDAKLQVGRPVNDLNSLFGVPLPVDNEVGTGSYDWHGRTTPSLPNSTKMTHYGFAATASFDVTENLTLKSITAYRRLKTDDFVDIDASQYQLGDVFVGVRQKQFSQELQGTYTSDRLIAVGGLYYLKEQVPSHQEAFGNDAVRHPLIPGITFLRTVDDNLTTKSYAAYGNLSYEVVVTSGCRRTSLHKEKVISDDVDFLQLWLVQRHLCVRAAERVVVGLVADGQRRLAGNADDDALCACCQRLQVGRL
jgi:iron complex outermembrane receptor protein